VATSPNLARAARKIEELPCDDGSILDTLAGSILRIFVRINQIEAMNERLMHKLKALEEAAETESPPTTRGNGAAPRAPEIGDPC
jgi:hypothetical protein